MENWELKLSTFWGTYPTLFKFISMFPLIGFKYPKRSFKRVVLELPFSPTIDINSFSGKVKFISFNW